VLNIHGVHDVRQKDIQMAEPLVPEPTLVKVEIAIGKLKSYKSLGTDQILTEFIKAGGCCCLFCTEYGGTATEVKGIYYCTNS
jgi:hypothetical protein